MRQRKEKNHQRRQHVLVYGPTTNTYVRVHAQTKIGAVCLPSTQNPPPRRTEIPEAGQGCHSHVGRERRHWLAGGAWWRNPRSSAQESIGRYGVHETPLLDGNPLSLVFFIASVFCRLFPWLIFLLISPHLYYGVLRIACNHGASLADRQAGSTRNLFLDKVS